MALTKDFRETIQARAQSDPAFREAMLTEAVSCFLANELATGKSLLRDYVNATLGFEELAKQVDKPSKSLHRMLAPSGNPSTRNLFAVIKALQKREGLCFEISSRHT